MNAKHLLSVLLLIAAAGAAWLAVRTGAQARRIVELEQALNQERTRVVPPPPAVQTAVPESAPQPAPHRPERIAVADGAAKAEIDGLRVRLLETSANQAKLQARISELETEVLNRAGEAARATSLEREARAQSADLVRAAEAAAAAKPASDQRLRDLEQELARVRAQSAASARKDADMSQVADELRDIARRQQTLAASILRRYRDVTDQFRALPGMLDPAGGPEANRIRTAMSMAEEDVRQLSDLTARMGRLEKRVNAR